MKNGKANYGGIKNTYQLKWMYLKFILYNLTIEKFLYFLNYIIYPRRNKLINQYIKY